MRSVKALRIAALGLAIAGAGVGVVSDVGATPVPVFGTGQETSAQGVDLHYSLISQPAGQPAGTSAYKATGDPNSGNFPLNVWVTPNTGLYGNHAWITPAPLPSQSGPTSNAALDRAPGQYVYQTTFDLAGFDLSTVVVNGNWASDNWGGVLAPNSTLLGNSDLVGSGIRLNGLALPFSLGSTAISYCPGPDVASCSFGHYSSFSLTSGFVEGVNTLDFIVTNANEPNTNHPTGLLASLSGEGSLASTPEPGTLLLLGSGLSGLSAVAWRRRRR